MRRLQRVYSLSEDGIAHFIIPIVVILIIAIVGGYIYLRGSNAATNAGYLESGIAGKCLDDSYDGKANYTKVQLYTCNKSLAQQWSITATGTIENANGACLDLNQAQFTNNTKIVMYACNSNAAQQWKVVDNTLVNSKSSKCIDDPYSNSTNGTQLILYTCKGTSNQRWTATDESGSTTTSDTSRSPYNWPFAWDSIWNIPIASTATYGAANIKSSGTYQDATSSDYDSINPSFPVVTLQNARLSSGSIGAVSVYGDPSMVANGGWNTCAAFLGTDKMTVYQGQTTEVTAGGSPKFGGNADVAWPAESIEGEGVSGCHGGSSLSGLGGTLTLTDLTQSGPITHALKVALDGYVNYSNQNGGYRWPATTSDTGYNIPSNGNYYGGSNPNVVEGSLLALPISIKPASFSNPLVAKLAQAMQDYGVYTVDTTASSTYDFSTLITNYNSASKFDSDLCTTNTPCGHPSTNTSIFSSQLDTLLQDLEVVTNNTATTPGGGAIGASRYASYAPKFTDGTDAPPNVNTVTP
jgi:hypothetical protein